MSDMRKVFAENLVMYRLRAGWSQEELRRRLAARGTSVHQTTVSMYERGKRMVDLEFVAACAEALELPIAALIAASGPGAGVHAEEAALQARKAMGDYLGDAVAVVLLDRMRDNYLDPNIAELAYRVMRVAGLGGRS